MTAAFESLQGARGPGEVGRLLDSRLAAYAYAALPSDAPERAPLRREYLAALARHHQIKGELRPLLAAWQAHGIDALIFKGFALAEFEYPAPGMRYHGDVDVVVREHDARNAVRIASELGWSIDGDSFALDTTYTHTVCGLTREGGATRVDLQRFVIHSHSSLNRVHRRVTDAVWSRSRIVPWNGVEARVSHPVDAIVVLALQRCWGDGWGIKAHDVLDLRLLAARIGPSWRTDVRARARPSLRKDGRSVHSPLRSGRGNARPWNADTARAAAPRDPESPRATDRQHVVDGTRLHASRRRARGAARSLARDRGDVAPATTRSDRRSPHRAHAGTDGRSFDHGAREAPYRARHSLGSPTAARRP